VTDHTSIETQKDAKGCESPGFFAFLRCLAFQLVLDHELREPRRILQGDLATFLLV
jgi:hypothetical protein